MGGMAERMWHTREMRRLQRHLFSFGGTKKCLDNDKNGWKINKKKTFNAFLEMEEKCFPQPKHDMQCWLLDMTWIPYQRSLSLFCDWPVSLYSCLSGSHLFGSNSPLLWSQLMNVYGASCVYSRGLLTRAGKRSTRRSTNKLQSVVFFCSFCNSWDIRLTPWWRSDAVAPLWQRRRWEAAGLCWCINSSTVISFSCDGD